MPARLRRAVAVLVIGALVGAFWAALPETFMTARNWLNISQQVSMLAVVAITMTVVMAMGDFDLSVGSTASLAGVVAAVLFAQGAPIAIGVAAALLVGVLGGVLNGLLVAVVGILPFVATLGTLTVFSGLAFYLSDGRTIFGRDIPEAFGGFAGSGLPIGALKLPNLTLVALVAFGIVWTILERRRFGRWLYAMGDSREAATYAGIPVVRMRIAAFAATGFGAAVAGLMTASRVASANPTLGAGLMLPAIAAVFLGMSMTVNGLPRVIATVAGVFVLGILDNGMTQLRVTSYLRDVFIGVVVLAAVGASALARRREGPPQP